MVVRDKVGRKRYIVFRVDVERAISRKDFERAVLSSFRMKGILHSIRPKLMDFDGEVGILRCLHTGKERAIEILNSTTRVADTEVRVETVKTSGTIRKARAIVNSLASDR
ncbi:MAG: Rpp14/Pop5 family protein [Candidatus Thorarchaeota archaeon]|jgi:RNase P/RNase MRP subunit POP5